MDKSQRNAYQTVLTVEPKRIEFTNVVANVKYVQTITVRNVTAHSRRIRFVPPGRNRHRQDIITARST